MCAVEEDFLSYAAIETSIILKAIFIIYKSFTFVSLQYIIDVYNSYALYIEDRYMELKAARTELNAKPKAITVEKIDKELEKEGQKIFYFDRENSHKDLMEMVEHFEAKGYSVYFREIRFGLNENDYLYEVHILS